LLGVPPERHAWLSERVDTFGRAVAGQRHQGNGAVGYATIAELLGDFDEALAERADKLTTMCCPGSPASTGEARADLLTNCIADGFASLPRAPSPLVREASGIVEHGTYDELLDRRAAYFDPCNAQFAAPDVDLDESVELEAARSATVR